MPISRRTLLHSLVGAAVGVAIPLPCLLGDVQTQRVDVREVPNHSQLTGFTVWYRVDVETGGVLEAWVTFEGDPT